MSRRIEASGPGGVSKRYGPLGVGGTAGTTMANNGEGRFIYEFSPVEADGAELYSFRVPNSYGKVRSVYVEVEEAFAASSTVNVQRTPSGGSAADLISAPVALTAAGIVDATLVSAQTTIAEGDTVDVVLSSQVNTSTTGYAKVVVEYERV